MLKSLFITIAITLSFTATANHELTINIKKIKYKSTKGKIGFAIYNNSNGFPKSDAKAMQRFFIDGSKTSQTITLPTGNYAIALFHDINSNQKLDKKIFGIPKEPFGFSNNPRITVGAPKFKNCQFKLDGDREISINLKYY